MAVGKATVLAVAIFGTVMFAGVRRDVSPRADLTTTRPMSQLVKRVKPLVNDGADMNAVIAEFQTAEDFAATVHASRNIRVPFMALKQQVVDERKTLAGAIHVVKPGADAALEADLARSLARADLAALK
jgi:hypothetical protein